MSYKVFISYSTKDIGLINRFRTILNPSVETFIAKYSILPGGNLAPEIITAIKSCDLFILMWSQNSKVSEWVPQEIGIAVSENKIILPVVLEPNIILPGFIKDRKYLPIYENHENSINWLRQNIFERAQEKQKRDGLVWLTLGGAFIWLLNQK